MTTETQRAMEALLELSGFPQGQLVDRMEKLIAKAPDPETACQVITEEFKATGALEKKWRKIITQTWQLQHESSAYPLDLPLTSQDVMEAESLLDARRLLEELEQRPAKMIRQEGENVIAGEEVARLVAVLPSVAHRHMPEAFEHEWASVQLRRLRLILQTLRLLRVYRGELHVVASRYKRFLDLPLPQQFYAIWHTDVYHVPWGHFAASWAGYADCMQEYVPLLWDAARDIRAGQAQTATELVYALMDLFQPYWEQEGLIGNNRETFMGLYEEYAVPAIVGQLLIRDILARHGLIDIHEGLPALISAHEHSMFDSSDVSIRWTEMGEILLQAERTGDLPCGIDILE